MSTPTTRIPQPIDLTSYPETSPYELVPVTIGGKPTMARPIAMDSEPVDKDYHNAAGDIIKPIRFSSSCPECGSGMILDVAPGGLLEEAFCSKCKLGPALLQGQTESAVPRQVDEAIYQAALEAADPFCNPVEAGLVDLAELGTLVPNLGQESPGTLSDPTQMGEEPPETNEPEPESVPENPEP